MVIRRISVEQNTNHRVGAVKKKTGNSHITGQGLVVYYERYANVKKTYVVIVYVNEALVRTCK